MDCYRAAETIKTIAQRFGADVIWDAVKMKSLFKDFAPELKEESKLIAMVYESGTHKMLMNGAGDVSDRMNQLGAFKRQLMNTLYISENAANDVMTIFAIVLGWESSIPSEAGVRRTRSASGQIPYAPPFNRTPTYTQPVNMSPINPDTQQKNSKAPIITAAVIALIGVAAAIFAVCVIYFGPGRKDDSPDKTTQPPEPTKLEEQTDEPNISYYTASPTNTPVTDSYKIDYNFNFAYNQSISPNPTYTKMYNNKYSYSCDIPDSFVREDYTNERCSYRAGNNSAIIILSANYNSERKNMLDIKREYIMKNGGSVEYESDNDGWFVVSTNKNGMVYYYKCYVGNYIRSLEMVYPYEYLEDYNDYVTRLSKNFQITD
ncbi:MAG: hypothetical protein J1G06_00675 [Oscillospiraceae bacterium]|nr:hypothetical protein [Oscillospiraceae bacterium]